MSEVICEKSIKVDNLLEPIEVMIFDDASLVMMHTDSKNDDSDKFPISMERWEYDHEIKDYYVRGKLSITEGMNHRQIGDLSRRVKRFAKQNELIA